MVQLFLTTGLRLGRNMRLTTRGNHTNRLINQTDWLLLGWHSSQVLVREDGPTVGETGTHVSSGRTQYRLCSACLETTKPAFPKATVRLETKKLRGL